MASLLLLSNSTLPGEPYLGWALPYLRAWLGAAPRHILFVPYAGVTIAADAYTARVRAALAPMGHAVSGAHGAGNSSRVSQPSSPQSTTSSGFRMVS